MIIAGCRLVLSHGSHGRSMPQRMMPQTAELMRSAVQRRVTADDTSAGFFAMWESTFPVVTEISVGLEMATASLLTALFLSRGTNCYSGTTNGELTWNMKKTLKTENRRATVPGLTATL
jgi:hypothetical protein